MSNCVQHIQPDVNCEDCNGSGYINDEIDDGERRFHFTELCDCVTRQAVRDDVIIVVNPQDEDSCGFDDYSDPDPIMSQEEQTLMAIAVSSDTFDEWQAKEIKYFEKHARTP